MGRRQQLIDETIKELDKKQARFETVNAEKLALGHQIKNLTENLKELARSDDGQTDLLDQVAKDLKDAKKKKGGDK